MRVVEPSVTLVSHTPDPERLIERMGRTCYQSTHETSVCGNCGGTGRVASNLAKGLLANTFETCTTCGGAGTDASSAREFVKMIIARGHDSVLEHAGAGFSIVTDRGVTHDVVRHWRASYSQESTRYCNYGKEKHGEEISVVRPPGLTGEQLITWKAAVGVCELSYLTLLRGGAPPEIARSVLPTCLKSEICMTANFREWRHFLRLLTSPRAHPQMREVALMVGEALLKLSDACFADVLPGAA